MLHLLPFYTVLTYEVLICEGRDGIHIRYVSNTDLSRYVLDTCFDESLGEKIGYADYILG